MPLNTYMSFVSFGVGVWVCGLEAHCQLINRQTFAGLFALSAPRAVLFNLIYIPRLRKQQTAAAAATHHPPATSHPPTTHSRTNNRALMRQDSRQPTENIVYLSGRGENFKKLREKRLQIGRT